MAIRPNKIFAVILPFPLLDSESAQSVVQVVGAKLLKPSGLRTLDTDHHDYRGVYDGDPQQRNAALPQGPGWSWLLGPYVSALVKANGAAGRTEATKLLQHFEVHALEDGLGQVSELFWGNNPHWPRGCPASTLAVAEVLRAYVEPSLAHAKPDDKFQFERNGYFVADRKDHTSEKPVFNLAVTLREASGK